MFQNKTKILSGLLVALIVVVIIFAPFKAGAVEPIKDANPFSILNPANWIPNALAAFFNFFLGVAAWVLVAAGKIFDLALDVSILDFNKYAEMDAINNAWIILRDIVNLFFIFIILYISIGTILQLSTYNMKSLLTTVIIIALLVNFSLMFTKVIIDMSNVLALEFYNSLTHSPSDPLGERVKLSDTIAGSLKVQTVFRAYDEQEDALVTSQLSTVGVISAGIAGIAYLGITAYVFLSFAFMFIIRTAILLFMMVLSPLAFLGMALPGKMGGKAGQWWSALFDQALFAPACLFLVYVSVSIMKSGTMLELTNQTSNSGALDFLFKGEDISMLLYYAMVITFMLASLSIAKSMAATGSQGIYNYGDKARDWAINGTKYAGAWSLRKAGELGKKEKDGQVTTFGQRRAAQMNRWSTVPIIGGGIYKASQYLSGAKAFKEGQKDEVERISRLSVKEQTTLIKSPIRGSLITESTKREWFKGLSTEKRVQMRPELGEELYNKLEKGLSIEDREKTEKRRKEVTRKASVNGLKDFDMTQPNSIKKLEEDIAKVKPKEAADLDLSIFGDRNKMDAMIKNFHDGHLKVMKERTDSAYTDFINALKSKAGAPPKIKDLQAYLVSAGNQRLAEWAGSPGGINTLKTNNFQP